MYIFVCLFLFLIYKFINYIYKVYTLDCSEFYKCIKNADKQIIFAAYGHTSFFDVPFIIKTCYSSKSVIGIAKNEYKWMYPSFLHKYLYFIDKNTKNTSKLEFNKHVGILIEGTRRKLPYLRSGFKHIAKNNNMDIVYWINNYKDNKIQLSTPIDPDKSDEELLDHLKNFVKDIPPYDYSIYPKNISEIRFKDE